MKPVISDVNPAPFDLPSETMEVYLPHHITVTIRERNGEDEGILSRIGDFNTGKAIPKFLASIITGPKKFTMEEIQKWPMRSKYYLMYKERVAYFGSLVTWTPKFTDDQGNEFEVAWEEDIAKFDRNLLDTITPYKPEQIVPYPKDKTKIEHTTKSNKKFRMDYLTGEGEAMSLAIPQDDIDINTRFILRNLEVQDKNGVWHPLQNFKNIPARDLQELRDVVEKEDPEFSLVVSIVNPKTKEVTHISLFGVHRFFYQ